MPNKRSIGLGQNPQILSLLKYVDYITLAGAEISYERDPIGEYLNCESPNMTLRTKNDDFGLLHIFVTIGATDYTNEAVINGKEIAIEDKPNMTQLLRNGGEICFDGKKMRLIDDDIYVDDRRVGIASIASQAIALREMGVCSVSHDLPDIVDIDINVKQKSITVRLSDKARKLDIIDFAVLVFRLGAVEARKKLLNWR